MGLGSVVRSSTGLVVFCLCCTVSQQNDPLCNSQCLLQLYHSIQNGIPVKLLLIIPKNFLSLLAMVALCGYSRVFPGELVSNDSGVIEKVDFSAFGR